MKKTFLLICSLFLFVNGNIFSQTTASLFLHVDGNNALIVSINGRALNENPVRDIFISGIPGGTHSAEVTVLRPGIDPATVTQNLVLTNGLEKYFKVVETVGAPVYTPMLSLISSKTNGTVDHSMHPNFKVTLNGAATTFMQGNYNVTAVPNNFDPYVNPWDSETGWKDMNAPANTGPIVTGPITTAGDSACHAPMGYDDFTNAKNRIKAKPIESTKLAIAKDIVENGCFSCMQGKELLDLFSTDPPKIELAKMIWHKTTDAKNWTIIYDAFTYGSSIDEVKAYVKAHPAPAVIINTPTNIVYPPIVTFTMPVENPFTTTLSPTTINAYITNITAANQLLVTFNGILSSKFTFEKSGVFILTENLVKGNNTLVITARNDAGSDTKTQTIILKPEVIAPPPVYVQGYNGPCGCLVPMDAKTFSMVKSSVESKSFADGKKTVIKQAVSTNCVTVDQTVEIVGLLTFESDKIELAKYCWGYAYDLNNYYKVNDAFTFESSISELDAYVKANPRKGMDAYGNNVIPSGGCGGPMDGKTLEGAKASVGKALSSSTKITVMKQILDNNCPNASQIKELMGLLSFESDKIEIAKYAWKKCWDPNNYYQVNDAFAFSSSITELDKYLKANPR